MLDRTLSDFKMKLYSVKPTFEVTVYIWIKRARRADPHLAKGPLNALAIL